MWQAVQAHVDRVGGDAHAVARSMEVQHSECADTSDANNTSLLPLVVLERAMEVEAKAAAACADGAAAADTAADPAVEAAEPAGPRPSPRYGRPALPADKMPSSSALSYHVKKFLDSAMLDKLPKREPHQWCACCLP